MGLGCVICQDLGETDGHVRFKGVVVARGKRVATRAQVLPRAMGGEARRWVLNKTWRSR